MSTTTKNNLPLTSPDFLFPTDLQKTERKINRILLVGSCLTSLYLEAFKGYYPDINFDYIPYNFVSILPKAPPAPTDQYDLQYVQIPLRTVLSDRVVEGFQLNDPAVAESILNDAFNTLDVMLDAALLYNREHGLLTFVSNFMAPQMSTASSLLSQGTETDLTYMVRRLNMHLARKISSYKNAYVLDVDSVASSLGKRYVLDDIIYFHTHGGLSFQDWDDFGAIERNEPIPALETIYPIHREEFVKTIFRQIVAAYRTVHQVDQVKAVIFDLDNTLWRGQIAEHYRPEVQPWPRTDGWPVGLWETVQTLRARGILVAICSKNDEAYVRERWDDIINPQFIKLEDFASVKINWVPKPENIAAICQEFNIKPKSVVFVDDNPVERASVNTAFPEIRTIGGNPYLTRRILLWSPETQVARLTQESAQRETMIRRQIAREETRASLNREEFLASLECTVSLTYITDTEQPELARALELTNKTNQFNTSGKRWTFEELTRFLTEGGEVIVATVQDKFTNYGLVSVLYLRNNEIVQFVMSCRVLGMEVEKSIVADVVSHVREKHGDVRITASIHDLPDNTPCRNIYKDCDFREDWVSENIHYYILDENKEVEFPSHIEVVEEV